MHILCSVKQITGMMQEAHCVTCHYCTSYTVYTCHLVESGTLHRGVVLSPRHLYLPENILYYSEERSFDVSNLMQKCKLPHVFYIHYTCENELFEAFLLDFFFSMILKIEMVTCLKHITLPERSLEHIIY